jgi:hypothetical protein
MRDVVYFPIHCPHCGRISMTSLSTSLAQSALETGRPLAVACVYDDRTWSLSDEDRGYIARLLAENTLVDQLPLHRLLKRSASIERDEVRNTAS